MIITHEERAFYAEKLKQNCRIEGGCWWWLRGCGKDGYGLSTFRGKTVRVHRLAYAVFKGDFDDSWHVLHECDNRRCINPACLWLGTNADNQADMYRKGRGNKARGETSGMFGRRGAEHPMFGKPGWLKGKGHLRSRENNPMFGRVGETNPNVKRTDDEIRHLFYLQKEGFGVCKIAELTNISKAQVSAILRGKNWKHIYEEQTRN
jgi:HNH endonuclease